MPESELTKIAAGQTPAKRRSKLDPHLADLRRLQSEGYSLAQLKTFLGEIGVTVSRQSIYDFLKRRESVITPTIDATVVKNVSTQGSAIEKPAAEKTVPNPLHALSGTPKEGNHIPKAKFEVDES